MYLYACAEDDVFYYEYYVGRISYDGKCLTPFRVAAKFCLVAGMLFVIEPLMDLWWRTSRQRLASLTRTEAWGARRMSLVPESSAICSGPTSPWTSPAGQRTTAASRSPSVRLGRPLDVPDTGIIYDLLGADLAKDIAGWAENDRGVSFVFRPDADWIRTSGASASGCRGWL